MFPTENDYRYSNRYYNKERIEMMKDPFTIWEEAFDDWFPKCGRGGDFKEIQLKEH